MYEKTKDEIKAAKMNCLGHNQSNEEGYAIQQWAQAADRYSVDEKSKIETRVAAGLGRVYPSDRELATVAQRVCERHQLTAAKCLQLGAGRKPEAARERKTAQERKAAWELEAAQKRRKDQYPSHAPQYRNQLEAGGQIVNDEVEGELLV